MPNENRIAILGAGNIGWALIKGMVTSADKASSLYVGEPRRS